MIYELFKNWHTEGDTLIVDTNEITHYDRKYALVKSLLCVLGCSLVNCSTPLFCRTISKLIQITSKLH